MPLVISFSHFVKDKRWEQFDTIGDCLLALNVACHTESPAGAAHPLQLFFASLIRIKDSLKESNTFIPRTYPHLTFQFWGWPTWFLTSVTAPCSLQSKASGNSTSGIFAGGQWISGGSSPVDLVKSSLMKGFVGTWPLVTFSPRPFEAKIIVFEFFLSEVSKMGCPVYGCALEGTWNSVEKVQNVMESGLRWAKFICLSSVSALWGRCKIRSKVVNFD